MNISQFSKGDFITRSVPVVYPNGLEDFSYTGDKLEFICFYETSNLIHVNRIYRKDAKEQIIISSAMPSWKEGWEKWPSELF